MATVDVGLIGYGWIGKAMYKLYPEAKIYDPGLEMGSQAEVNQCSVVFVAVPTPLKDGRLDTSIVEEVVGWCESPLIIIRSAVNPGDCDRWEKLYGRNIVNMPEYLGETPAHPLLDESKRQFIILGGRPQPRRQAIEVLQQTYNANITIRQVTNLEAEIIKLSENRAIGFKVAQCQELYDACQAAGVDYYTIRDAVYGDDPRFTLWWTFIYPEQRGFDSKCIPKDIYAWSAWAEDSELTDALLKYNDRLLNAQCSDSQS